AELPNECCGLLAGRFDSAGKIARVECCYPLVNKAHSPVRYLSEETSLFGAHRDMRQRSVEVLAVYHSHPTSPPVPSRTDLDQNWEVRDFLGDVVHLIVSLIGSPPLVRGWWLTETEYREADWKVA